MEAVVLELRITILMENTCAKPGLVCEHGFSALLELEGQSLLFDTGSSGSFIDNAAALGIDLSVLSHVVLSHAHWDHTCGFTRFSEGKTAQAYTLCLSKYFFAPKFSEDAPGVFNYSGIPFSPSDLRRLRIKTALYSDGLHPVWEGLPVYLMPGIDRHVTFERIPTRFQLFNGMEFLPDPFQDEMALVVDTSQGLIVISGCSHNGMINTCLTAQNRLGKPVRAFIGGTHLVDAREEQIARTMEYLKDCKIAELAVCHCTGEAGLAAIAESCDNYRTIGTGSQLTYQI